ncbi:response regulator transcription factor [Sulfurimonas sp.]|uniref:response regulator transcription factor n=1 Tax=Sulfurimonas sp. TaxID=2022749 RepID=UPI003D1216D9
MIIYFSKDINLIDEWKQRAPQDCYAIDELDAFTDLTQQLHKDFVMICDYDSVANDVNKLISSDQLFSKTIVLEKVPEIATGKMLISHGVKAYGNSRMLQMHYNQMIHAVSNGKIWTYPELTLALVKSTNLQTINPEARELIEHRLTEKEKEVVTLVVHGLSNDAIAHKLGITPRTVKAHITSIFEKLHVSDRVSLILLLK